MTFLKELVRMGSVEADLEKRKNGSASDAASGALRGGSVGPTVKIEVDPFGKAFEEMEKLIKESSLPRGTKAAFKEALLEARSRVTTPEEMSMLRQRLEEQIGSFTQPGDKVRQQLTNTFGGLGGQIK